MMPVARLSAGLPVTGVPVLFLPGNAGSYAQVRSLASETARQAQRELGAAVAATAGTGAAQHGDASGVCSNALRAGTAATDGDSGQTQTPGSNDDDGGDSCVAPSTDMAEGGPNGGFGDLAWYAADFGEELSAFDGKLLVRAPAGLAAQPCLYGVFWRTHSRSRTHPGRQCAKPAHLPMLEGSSLTIWRGEATSDLTAVFATASGTPDRLRRLVSAPPVVGA